MKQADFLKAHPVKPFDTGDLATALGKAVEDFKRLPIDLRASKLVDALVAVYPELKITTTYVAGARVSSTKDKDNVKALATAAGKLFIAIASGSEDDSLREVFGDRNLAKAKKKYAAGEKMMNKLVKAGDVVVDRSGYRDESGIAGSSKPGGPIMLNPSTLDDPGAIDSVRTMLDESMHAGNADVGDKGYVKSPASSPRPRTSSSPTPRTSRWCRCGSSPRSAASGSRRRSRASGSCPPRRPARAPAPAAAQWRPARRPATPSRWRGTSRACCTRPSTSRPMTPPPYGISRSAACATATSSRSWSKVEKLTIHERLGRIDSTAPPGFHRAKAPVTEIDVALSEEIVRDLGDAMDAVPNTDADLAKLYAEAKLPQTARCSATARARSTSSAT